MYHLGIPQSGMCGTRESKTESHCPWSSEHEMNMGLQVLPLEKEHLLYNKWAELSPLFTDWPQHQRTGIY